MKILYWTPLFWPEIGGTQTMMAHTLPVLMERGYHFLVVASHGGLEQPDIIEWKGIQIRRYPFWSALGRNDIHLIMKINQQIIELKHKYQPDLIHIDLSGYTAYFQQLTAKWHPALTLIAVHNSINGLDASPGTILGNLFDIADWVTTVSNAALADIRRMVPEITGRSSTIYACAGQPNLSPTQLPFEIPCIIGIGRLVQEKGFDVFLEAIPFVLERFPNLSIKIIGDGPERESLDQRATRLGLKKSVEFIGSIPNEDIPEWINHSTLVVVPSRNQETFGIVAVEASIMGRPVVAVNVGGLAEIIEHNKTGLLVEMENPLALSEAIIKLLSDPERTRKLGRTAQLRAQRKFSVLNYVNAYDALYQKLVTTHSFCKRNLADGIKP